MHTEQSTADLIASVTADYRAAGNTWPATTKMVAEWALETGKLDILRSTAVTLYSRMFHQAWRSQLVTDPQGRRVRKYHSSRATVNDEQLSLWAEMGSASRDFMVASFRDRRNQIVADAVQLSTDVDSYNENFSRENPVQLTLDFTADVELIKQVQREPASAAA